MAQIEPSQSIAIAAKHKRPFFRSSFFKNYLAVAAGVVIIMIVLLSIFAPIVAPYGPNDQDLSLSLQPASGEHLFGTDKQGRDIFSRVIFGARTTLLGAVFVVGIATVIGVPLGLIAGYYGGRIDSLITRAFDVILAFPALLLAFIIVAVFGRGLENAVIALGIVYIPMIARVVRSVTLVQKEQTYVEAARNLGFSNLRIIFIHILPNCISPIVVQCTIDLAYAILDLAAMSFLGLGVQPPTADWGAMLEEGRQYLLISPNTALASGFAIMITVIAFNLFGDGLQQHFDPKQRKV
ncbi:ABC transporter permease [Bacillus sp. S/N-304-OC-R1]|uniref:ABC transporter permease n=1 Tax=Bacillus sp. S/N-304-OC-R1 TaxID=2758034 RepID=UPI0021AF0054|nr:ABC transporter permease [Bacillus sp. S/N-304-OC-R1]